MPDDQPTFGAADLSTVESQLLRPLDAMRQRVDTLRQQAEADGALQRHPALLEQAIEELGIALEELRVSAEELQTQNEELFATHASLETERARYRELFDFAPDGYVVTDSEGIITEVNRAARGLLYCSPTELIGKPLALFVAKPDRPKVRSLITQLGSIDREHELDVDLVAWVVDAKKKKKKKKTPVAIKVDAEQDRSGRTLSLRWLLRDVTERQRDANALAQRARMTELAAEIGAALAEHRTLRELLDRCARSLVRHVDAALARIWTFDQAEQVLELQASAGMYTHLDGAHSRVALGQYKIGLIAQERRPHLTNAVIGDPWIHDQKWARRERLVAFAGFPLLLEDRLIGVMALFARQPLQEDIVETLSGVAHTIALGIDRKQGEDELCRRAVVLQKQADLLDRTHDSVFVRDLDGVIHYWNRAAEDMYGWTKQEAIGRCTHDILRTEFPRPFAEIKAELLRTGAWAGELVHVTRDGKRLLMASRWTLERSRDGELAEILETNTNITKRRETENALVQLSRRLLQLKDEEQRRIARDLHDSTGQLLAGLEMNLGVLSGSSQRLDRKGRAALNECVALASDCSREIRTLSYLLHPPLLDELGLTSATLGYLDGFARRSGVQVDAHIAPDLGRMPQKVELALFRILQEALTNVQRHSGSKTVHIKILRDSAGVTLEVSDRGHGAQPAASSHETTTGVGIAGMRERVAELGGHFDLVTGSEGTTMRVQLPLADASEAQA